MTDTSDLEYKPDFDICYLKGKLARARADGDMTRATKLAKQIELLEDCVIIYKMTRESEQQVS